MMVMRSTMLASSPESESQLVEEMDSSGSTNPLSCSGCSYGYIIYCMEITRLTLKIMPISPREPHKKYRRILQYRPSLTQPLLSSYPKIL
jgi:hypothetical protein